MKLEREKEGKRRINPSGDAAIRCSVGGHGVTTSGSGDAWHSSANCQAQ